MNTPLDRTEVCITIDTEFSIAGSFEAPDRFEPVGERMVYGAVQGEEQGLGFLLECFDRCGIRATFFVEPLNFCYFGDEPMRGITRRILETGQDVQLHTHPVWLYFQSETWKEDLAARSPNGTFVGRPVDEVVDILRLGIRKLEQWGAPRPVALRTGSLFADPATYRAMREVDLLLSSNLGIAYYRPPDPELQIRGGRRKIHGVLELPVLTFSDWRGDRLLTVTGTSWPEMRHLLWSARSASLPTVVILTHPFEYIKTRDFQYSRMGRNRVNQRRLEQLCRFLKEHDQDFVSRSFAESRQGWLHAGQAASPDLSVPFLSSVTRMAHNRINDVIWWY